jgi:transcriptional regulator with GAF, ATPase, and Fis domain
MRVSSVAIRETQLAEAFVGLADTLVADFDVVDLLQRLVDECVSLLDASAAGLVLSNQRGGIQVLASSSEKTRLLELFQVRVDRGPCLDCVRTGLPVLAPDLELAKSHWPDFVIEAMAQGFRSVHALPLRLRTETLGALGLFHIDSGPLPDDDLKAAQALADVATIGILQQRSIARGEILAEQLQAALNSRVVIEQAKGVLAATGSLDMDHAYARLRDYSRRRNLRLTAAARAIAEGTLNPHDVLSG